MSDHPEENTQVPQKHLEIWTDLADLVNNLPPEDRKRYRNNLGKFMHDLRHTLGLITNSEDLIRRDLRERPDSEHVMALLDIVRTGARRATVHLTDIVESFGDKIEMDE